MLSNTILSPVIILIAITGFFFIVFLIFSLTSSVSFFPIFKAAAFLIHFSLGAIPFLLKLIFKRVSVLIILPLFFLLINNLVSIDSFLPNIGLLSPRNLPVIF